MLEKGTITKKGKLRSKKRRTNVLSDADRAAMEARTMNSLNKTKEDAERKRNDSDFVGDANLGDLDMDQFLSSVVEADLATGDDKVVTDDGDDEDSVMDGSDDDSSDEEGDGKEIMDGVDSDDEDVEAVEEQMKADMAKLAESDPDFHKYLADNESSLLEFTDDIAEVDDDEDDEEDDEDEDDEDEDGTEETKPKPKKPKQPKDNRILVNAKTLQSYERGAFTQHGIKALKRILAAYRSACHMADANDPEEDGSGRLKRVDTSRRSYHIESSVVFDRLMVICLTNCHEEFKYHLLGKGAKSEFGDENDDDDDDMEEEEEGDKNNNLDESGKLDLNRPIPPRQMTKSIRWPQIKVCINSFLKATLHLLTESAKESQLITFLLKSLANYIPFLTAFPNYGKPLLKQLVSMWSSTTNIDNPSNTYHSVRVESFLRMRQMALTQPFPFIETLLKSSYLAYAKSAKFANAAATVSTLLPTLTFMGNCVVELYSLDYASSYQHAFVYIRQLALHLRTAMQKKTPEAVRVVYCWQYLHCLKLWTAVLASSCRSRGTTATTTSTTTITPRSTNTTASDGDAALLRSLIYPLVEIIFGVARLIPTARHLPLRLHCVRYLQQLAAFSESYIPTTSILLEAFDLKEMTMAPKREMKKKKGESGGKSGGGDIRGVRLPVVFKLPKVDALRNVEQLDACLGELFTLLGREVELYRYSAGLPEFTIRICQRLRKFSKETRNGKYRAYARGCIELCEKYSKFAITARSALEEAPSEIKRLEILLPTFNNNSNNSVPNMGARYDAAIAREKPFEAIAQPALSKSAKAKAAKGGMTEEVVEVKDTKGNEVDKKKRKKRAKKVVLNQADLKNTAALDEKDEVSEGINWSESEADDDDDDDDDDDNGDDDSTVGSD